MTAERQKHVFEIDQKWPQHSQKGTPNLHHAAFPPTPPPRPRSVTGGRKGSSPSKVRIESILRPDMHDDRQATACFPGPLGQCRQGSRSPVSGLRRIDVCASPSASSTRSTTTVGHSENLFCRDRFSNPSPPASETYSYPQTPVCPSPHMTSNSLPLTATSTPSNWQPQQQHHHYFPTSTGSHHTRTTMTDMCAGLVTKPSQGHQACVSTHTVTRVKSPINAPTLVVGKHSVYEAT